MKKDFGEILLSFFTFCRSTPLVQLIALIYKDQHVTTLERLLNIWLESSLSDSSEDNESNTSPHNIQDGNGCCSSSLLTSTEPNSTDDSSDGNGHGAADGIISDKGTCGTCKFDLKFHRYTYRSVEKRKIQSHLERVCQSWIFHLGNDYVI